MANYPIYRLIKGSTLSFTEMDGNLEWLSANMSASVVTITGSTFVLGNLTVSDGITGSLFGTSSWANNTISASYVSGSAAVVTNLSSSNDASINGLTVGRGGGGFNTNTAFGSSALLSNTGNNQNTGIGFNSLRSLTSGDRNTSIGSNSSYSSIAGRFNTSVGVSSLYNSTGNYNIGIGYTSGFTNTAGSSNIYIGSNSSVVSTGITTGNNNTIIGSNITGLSSTLNNNIILADGQGNIKYRWDGTQNTISGGLNVTGGPITGSDALLTGTLTVQTIVAQTITASTEWITGSSKFGSLVTDTHQFTGSLLAPDITGSLFGTSSWAVSASWAPSNAPTIVSYIATGSVTASVSNTDISASFRVTSGSNTLLNVTKDGFVWIGNGAFANAGYQLDVNGTARVVSYLEIGDGANGSTYINFKTLSSTNTWVGAQSAGGSQWVNGGSVGDFIIRRNAPSSNSYLWLSLGNLGEAGYRYTFANGTAIYKDNGTTFTTHASSILSLDSVSRGFLPPRMTETQKNAIVSPAQGLHVYDIDTSTEGLWYYLSGSIKGWSRVLNDTGSQVISGSLIVTQGFTGSLQGTSSWAVSASWAPSAGGGTTLNGSGYVSMSGTNVAYVSSIPNADLANSSITIQGASTALGGSVNVINGTGFVKSSGTTITYDNSTYYSASNPNGYTSNTGTVTGTGTTNYLPKWTSATALGNSIIDDDGFGASVLLSGSGGFIIKYDSGIKLALKGDSTYGSIDLPADLDFLIKPDSVEQLKLSSTGSLRLAKYGMGSVIGTAAYQLAVTSNGDVIETSATNNNIYNIDGTLSANRTIDANGKFLKINNLNKLTLDAGAETNDVALFKGVEPNIHVSASGASNAASLFLSPSPTFNGTIQNRTGGGLQFYVGATPSVALTIASTGYITTTNSLIAEKIVTNGDPKAILTVTGSFNTTGEGVGLNIDIDNIASQTASLLDVKGNGVSLFTVIAGQSVVSNLQLDVNNNINVNNTGPFIYLNDTTPGNKGYFVTNASKVFSITDDTSPYDGSGLYLTDGDLYVTNTITASGDLVSDNLGIRTPTLDSGPRWKLGDATAGTVTPDTYIKVEINGQIYSIPALLGTP